MEKEKELAMRVARLERESRLWRAGLLLVAAAIALAGAKWSRPSLEEVVRARRVVVFDERSTPRLDLRLSPQGAVLVFRDGRGREVAGLAVVEEPTASGDAAPRLLLVDPEGKALWSAP